MTPTDIIKLQIDEKAHSYAKIYSSLLSDNFQRKRAYASIAALYALINLLEKTDYDIQKSMTIFRNPLLNEQYEISDLYVNNWHIDVRIITDGNAFLVPKIHFDTDIVPDFYAVIKVDKKLTSAELIGFADTETMPKEGFDYHYYSVSNSNLISYEEFLNKVKSKKIINFKEEDHNLFKESYLSLMDNEIDRSTKNKILKHLFECCECRTEFCCFTGFEMVSCNLSKYPELLEDQTLNIVGAQAIDSSKYKDKEETIYFENKDEINDSPNTGIEENKEEEIIDESSKEQEETVSDILDELFNIDEETKPIEENTKEKSIIDSISPKDIIEQEDLDILDEDSSSNLLDLGNNTEDLEMIIEDNPKTESFSEEELNLIEENFLDINKKPDLVFIEEDKTTEIEPIKDSIPEIITEEPTIIEDKKEEDKVEKVIVDYDEFGEPIYSYITNVSDSNIESKTENEAKDKTIIDTEQNISEPDDISENIENTKDISNIEEIEDIKDDKENEIDEVTNTNSTISKSIVDSPNNITQLNQNNNFENDAEDEEEIQDFDEKLEDDPLFSDEDTFKEDDDELLDPEDDEYEEDESENDGIEQNKKTSKKGLIAGLFILIFIIASGGALFAMKYINAATHTSNTNSASQTEIPDANTTNDMFEQPETNEPTTNDLIAAENNVNNNIPTNNDLIPPPGIIDTPETENINIPAVTNNNINEAKPLTEKDLLTNNKPTGDINKVMSNAFSNGINNVSIRGVNWMCAPSLFTDKIFKNYLQNLDNILKLNLRKNILDTTDIPTNNSVAVKMAIDNNGNLLKTLVSTSSGSNEIDNIVLQSIKETVESQKTTILNDSEQKADKYFLQVVIKL